MATPSPQTWTLRLKSRKTTVLLHVDPLHTFATIKSYLYDALQETGLKDAQTGESIPLPSSPSDIQLGRPVNINDAHEGFQLGAWEYPAGDNDEEVDEGKGKGKAGRKSNTGATASAANVKDCPKGAGLKDGAVLAFRWIGDGMWDGSEEDMDIDGERERGGQEGDMWGVKLASFEDAYGVDNETDVGGGREFEG
ncbi:Nn.00g011960.m01.CDS01 [Neocucurbitaria sp. VM-36]